MALKKRWGTGRDSNPQQPEPQSGALPLNYLYHLVEMRTQSTRYAAIVQENFWMNGKIFDNDVKTGIPGQTTCAEPVKKGRPEKRTAAFLRQDFVPNGDIVPIVGHPTGEVGRGRVKSVPDEEAIHLCPCRFAGKGGDAIH